MVVDNANPSEFDWVIQLTKIKGADPIEGTEYIRMKNVLADLLIDQLQSAWEVENG